MWFATLLKLYFRFGFLLQMCCQFPEHLSTILPGTDPNFFEINDKKLLLRYFASKCNMIPRFMKHRVALTIQSLSIITVTLWVKVLINIKI